MNKYLLDNEDKKIIEKDKDKKWELISNKIKGAFKKYEKSDYYRAFIEIVDKSAQIISKGNKDAHHVNIEFYESSINEIIKENKKENKKEIINLNKLCFLIEIKISKNLLLKGYDFLETFYEDNMTRAFTNGKSFEDLFN